METKHALLSLLFCHVCCAQIVPTSCLILYRGAASKMHNRRNELLGFSQCMKFETNIKNSSTGRDEANIFINFENMQCKTEKKRKNKKNFITKLCLVNYCSSLLVLFCIVLDKSRRQTDVFLRISKYMQFYWKLCT